jgi:peptidyl-prolyl cis-trans isomerase A (cyclophilin A)
MLNKILGSTLLCLSCVASVNATIVEFQTSQGKIQVNLFDQTTPHTVANFLQYIDEEHYTNTVIHRVVPDFIIQGGGFSFDGELPLTAKETNPSVINEPVYSNVAGTIAMAKVGNQPNSATNQWFFNLVDNASNLDVQNEGFTVFGRLMGDDAIETLGKIEDLTLCSTASHTDVPIVLDEGQTCGDITAPGVENFVVIESITIVDSSEVTDADLSPVENTLIGAPEVPTTPDSDSGGGSTGLFSFVALLLLSMRKKIFNK